MRDPGEMTGREISKAIYYHKQRIRVHQDAVRALRSELYERRLHGDFDYIQKSADKLIKAINELEFVRAFSGLESDDSYIIRIEKVMRKDFEQED